MSEVGPEPRERQASTHRRQRRGSRRSRHGFTPEQRERRRSLVPRVSYPPELPVSRRRDDIAAAIRDHQVVFVAGETGSG
jgi:ATP-dependent helicase HrpA